jgi:uncharacterized repeat protein (TIGR02543 family)
MIITGDLYLSAGIEAGKISLDNVQVLGTVKIKGGTELYLSPETRLNTVVLATPVAITGEGIIQTAYINSLGVTLATNPVRIETAEGVTDFIVEEANINFASGYPRVSNIHTDRLDLLVKTEEKGQAYYLILPASKAAPNPEQIIAGRDVSDKSVDSRHYGQLKLAADEQTREQICGLRPATNYQLYLVLEDEEGNLQTEAISIKVTIKRKATTKTYSLIYTAGVDGSISGEATQTVKHGANGTAVTAVADTGYQFVDWSDGITDNPRTDTFVTCNISVTANFAINKYTVTFKDYDGTTLKTETIKWGNAATAPAKPTRAGYTFTGWDVDYTNVIGDLTVTAQYTINTYTVTFDKNGGDTGANPPTKTATYGGNVGTLPIPPTKTGHTFVGWNTAADGSGSIFTVATVVTANITVYAQWAEIKVTGISIIPKTLTLAVGVEGLLTVTITPDNAHNTNITWSNSNPEVATVFDNKVIAVSAGTTTITVKTEDGGHTDTCTITVVVPVDTITVTGVEGATTVEKGKTLQMIANVEPINATDQTITWTPHVVQEECLFKRLIT